MNVTEAIPIVTRVADNKLGLGVHEREAMRVVVEAATEWNEQGPVQVPPAVVTVVPTFTPEQILAKANELHEAECACDRVIYTTSGWYEYGELALRAEAEGRPL